jgi:hypothetical protein
VHSGAVRFLRGRRLDRNPLRRASDRVETVVLALLVAAFLAGLPFAAGAAGAVTRAVAGRVQAVQRATRSEVPAILLRAAPLSTAAPGVLPDVAARWTAPDGVRRTGQVSVLPGTPAGTTVRVWVTRDGQLTGPPMPDSQVCGQVALAEAGAGAALALVLCLAGLLARRSLDRRRAAAWDEEWRVTGPRWTTRA